MPLTVCLSGEGKITDPALEWPLSIVSSEMTN